MPFPPSTISQRALLAVTLLTVATVSVCVRAQDGAAASDEPAPLFRSLLNGLRQTDPETAAADPAPQDTAADDIAIPQPPTKGVPATEGELHFAFDRTSWRDVINWLASNGELALHVSDLPTGTFTYSDPNSFTIQEALDRINLFLLPEGFTLVRTGKLLSVIDLNDVRSVRQLDSLARLVRPQDLETLPDHDLVKCIMPLGDLNPEDAIEELSALNLIITPAVFTRTRQLMITDTVVKLRSAKIILDEFEPSTLDNGTMVKSFTLKHADAEDILVVARPHLGLATGEMIGIDVSLSSDPLGKSIFVTGIEDKVKLVENLINSIDVEGEDAPAVGDMELKAHEVKGNVELVFNVLQTLLVEETVRLSMDRTANTVVALATPEVHAAIEKTVLELEASDTEFEVIQLKSVDPYFAISLLEQMLDLTEEPTVSYQSSSYDRSSSRNSSRSRTPPPPAKLPPPKIDADPGNMRLYVTGKRHQIDQIKKIIDGLEAGNAASIQSGDRVRIFPLSDWQADEVLQTAAKFWRADNPVIYYPTAAPTKSKSVERVVADPTVTNDATPGPTNVVRPPPARVLTDNLTSEEPPVRCQMTPRGLLLQCEDPEILDQFEELLKTITGPGETTPAPPTVFYLKYTRAEDAVRMLAELLDGGEAAKEFEAGSLVNGYVSGSASSYLGSLITSRDGTITMMAGTITVVADTRLNRLIAQGTAGDVQTIERYLKIVDKDNSITAIETYGRSQVIELQYSRAADVAEAIRGAYAGRVSATAATGGGAQGGQSGRPGSQQQTQSRSSSSQDGNNNNNNNSNSNNSRGGSSGKPGAQKSSSSARSQEPKMTIAVHEPSNSLIVTAPNSLFQEVAELARVIDERNRKTVRILTLPDGVQIEQLQQVISNTPGGGATGASRASPSRTSTSRTGSSGR